MKLTAALIPLFAALVLAGSTGAMTGGNAGAKREYVIAFSESGGVPADLEQILAAAGGKVETVLPELAGVVASSEDDAFADAIAARPDVDAVSDLVLREFALPEAASDENGAVEDPGADPQPGSEPLYSQQWDKMRINASATGSYAVQRGRHDVTVAVLDTGADVTHPDIAPNLDPRSRSFVPSEPTIDDGNGHGTWGLSAVGAPINNFGISGVAPNVSLVALKVFNRNAVGSLVSVEQALVYAAEQRFDVAVMSFGVFGDRKADKAEIKLFERALKFARQNGVTLIAALGNSNLDLSDHSTTGDAVLVPGELSGVIGVSATGYGNQKAFYSSYGMGKVDVSAPGGDSVTQPAPGFAGGGRVLGAWSRAGIVRIPPALRITRCAGAVCHFYAWMQGTSMAAPNAAGVAALIVSQLGDFSGKKADKGHLAPSAVEAALQQTANNRPCPEGVVTYPIAPAPGLPRTATCQGGAGDNGFFGKGMVDALKAVTAR